MGSASEGKQVQVRLYENIVDEEKGVYNEEDGSINVNPHSLTVIDNCYVEPELMNAAKRRKLPVCKKTAFFVLILKTVRLESRCLTGLYR